MNLRNWLLIGAVVQAGGSHASDALTVYSEFEPGRHPQQGANGFAVISHDREYPLEQGVGVLKVTDVAAQIDPTTVTFQSLSDADTRVLEQRYEYDLVSQGKLLERFAGERIVVELDRGDQTESLSGVLLSSNDGLTLQLDDGSISTLSQWRHIRFPALPDGLITKPTLVWRLNAPRGGTQRTRLTYQTQGMAWWADYNLLLQQGQRCSADLNAWVSLQNQSGASYDQARLKLVAGEVNRLQNAQSRVQTAGVRMRAMALEEADAGFEEKAFFEYHLYTLGRPIDIPDNSTTQVELFPAAHDIKCRRELVVDGTRQWTYRGYPMTDSNTSGSQKMDVAVYLRLKNKEEDGLGMPLPEGRVRVSQVDPADGRVEFLGEDAIRHTPKNEELLIKVGNAFDVVGERKRTDFRVDENNHHLWESFQIDLRNHKEEAAEVVVLESLYRTANWEVTARSDDFEKLNANRIRFEISLPAGGEHQLTYTVHYTW
ncbi:MAG: DUF4139 domain-containing protein [Wenzhouxiangellaceae bacterium]